MNIIRPTIGNNKGGNMVKTITITLNKEQEELLLKKLDQATFRLTEKEITLINSNYKNPSNRTYANWIRAKHQEKKLEKEWEVSNSITDQLKKQLEGGYHNG
jgi:methionine aminopeptidase|tara:strand:+ start:10535 stop:10840 length:306 start_codon:yes stop_codon:yes gene_type:complete